MLQNFPITVFNRSDGKKPRWPTFGVKLSSLPPEKAPDKEVFGDVHELVAIARTALGEWNRYALDDDGVASRTVWVDTMRVQATDFHIDRATQQKLYDNGCAAAHVFLAEWNAVHAA
jgi:NTE family protein